jgi:hypothetical protein
LKVALNTINQTIKIRMVGVLYSNAAHLVMYVRIGI